METIDRSNTASEAAPAKTCCCCRSSCDEDAKLDVPADQATASAEQPALRLVLLEDAARCRGIEIVWSIFTEAVVEVPKIHIPQDPPLHLFTFAISNDRAIPALICPEPPIP